MDVMLRGRGAEIGVRAPLWLVRLCGAALAFLVVTMLDHMALLNVIGGPSIGLRLLTLAIGAWLATTIAGSLFWIAGGVLTTLYMIVACTPLAGALAPAFVRHDAAQMADAIVVLSGSMNEDGRLQGAVLDRLLSGMTEAKSRHVPTIGLSVVDSDRGGIVVTSEADQRALVNAFAPELELRLVRDVKSTRDEALQFAALARTHGWHRVIVVTSPLHSKRACRALEAVGLVVECFPAVPRDYSLVRLRGANARVRVFGDVVYETIATMVYSLRGWI